MKNHHFQILRAFSTMKLLAKRGPGNEQFDSLTRFGILKKLGSFRTDLV